jgi:hemoglobin/transferrin/lactoferrin receptor protein
MNNAIYRSGHLQNVLTIDPNAIERVEVLFGPGSVIYGSDALGGVMHFFTKTPKFSTNGKLTSNVDIMTRYASANQEKAGNVTLSFGLKKWAFLTNVSYKYLCDLTMGSNRDPFYGDWGKCLFYTERIDGKDSMITNSNPLKQKFTAYHQYDVMQKVLFKASDKLLLTANFQLSNSGDIPRYDRLQQIDKGKPVYSEWYYGPQKRMLGSLNALLTKGKWYDQISLTGAYQSIAEDRISRKFGKKAKKSQEERVDVLSFNADAMKKLGTENELRFGLEAVHNKVNSTAYNTNVETGEVTYDAVTRYPDNGNTMTTMAAYLTHNWEVSDKLYFPQGIRFSMVKLDAEYTDTMMVLTKFPFDKKFSSNNSAVNGNIGVVYMPGADWRFTLMGSTGFRSPNIDDLTKVNDSKAGSVIVIPNPDLKPEYANNAEITIGKTIEKSVNLELTGFYSKLKDAIVIKAFTLNGSDSVMYDGKKTAVQAAQNVGDAYIYGLQGNMLAQVTPSFSIQSTLTYTYGRIKENEMETPLDHIPPLYGMTSFKLKIKKFEGDFYIRYTGWKTLSDYSASGEDNLPNATALGNPGWYTLNLKTSFHLNQYLSIQAGIENMTDRFYRNFASGVSAPGRNFMVALRGNF